MINVFAVQQTRVGQPPVLVVEGIDRMYPSTLRVLALLAALQYQGHFALQIVLSGGSRAPQLLQSEGLAPVRQRTVTVYEVSPFSNAESMRYLHGRLEACGVERPDQVLPVNICDMLHDISGGLPGSLSENAKGVLAIATKLPVDRSAVVRQVRAMRKKEQERIDRSAAKDKARLPRLIVTSNGETVEEFEVRENKVTVGRSTLADITIYDQFASKMHALFIRYSDALVVVDLNSANGIFVNSVRVNSTILRNNDIVSLANHRVKVLDVPVADSRSVGPVTTSDTAKMKTLAEQRELKRQKQQLYEVRQDSKA